MQNRQMDTRGPGAADKNSSNIKTRSVMARNIVKYVSGMSKAAQRKDEEFKETIARQLRDIYFIDPAFYLSILG